jgi:tetratricopeptide (TPR) repeat protein
LRAQPTGNAGGTNEIRILELQGTAEVFFAGATRWTIAPTNQTLLPGDRLHTGTNSRVMLHWSDESVASFGALTEIEILPPHDADALSGLHLLDGILSFFHRDKPGRIRILTRGAVAGVEGTEFVMAVDTKRDTQSTTLSVIDGIVQFTNEYGALILTNKQQATTELGKAPARTAGFIVNNVLQWCFYYPAVLDLRDLPLTSGEQQALAPSLAAYRSGDLLQALAKYPPSREPASDADDIYHAALLLSVGQVGETENILSALDTRHPTLDISRLAAALRQLIAAVRRDPFPSTLNSQLSTNSLLSTEFLASSSYEQSRATGDQSLRAALRLARQAAANSPDFGFAWERVAELEFSFGRTAAALEALNRSLELSPRNAQALALKGFLLAAQNQTREAIEWFNQAIAADAALGNAWLGRGLCKIRLGSPIAPRPSPFAPLPSSLAPRPSPLPDTSAQEDLLIAAALEPQRSLLRSYLGKAYADGGDDPHATRELKLARDLDPKDPTPWLYSALLKQQQHRLNEAAGDLEASQERNDNRSLFRSRLLLDQDRAVRSASLASIYRDNGMTDVSVREAASAVPYDYANYSAHLFLANSFDALRDPTRFNLRYETAWFNELLLANLLAPVGAGVFAQNISQQEYSRFFDVKKLGLTTTTDARSDGQYRELASQFGAFGNFGYSLDLDYQHNDRLGARGRPNNGLDRIEWYSQFKFQLTPFDTLFLLTKYQDYHSGDNFQYYDWRQSVRTNFTFDEFQTPIVVGGYHHEWSPGAHTLLLAGRLDNDQRFRDRIPPGEELLINKDTNNVVQRVRGWPFEVDADYRSKFRAYTVEMAHILQGGRQALEFGGRVQSGQFDTQNELGIPTSFQLPQVSTNTAEDFRRATGYAYYTLEPVRDLFVTAGLSYDNVEYPENFRSPPISPGQRSKDLLGPKAALAYSPQDWMTVRGIYARSLGGVSLDQSYRLEPTQLAGFVQTFRSVIPESVVGSVSAPTFETYGAALDLKFRTSTYVGIEAEMLSSDVDQELGVFESQFPNVVPSSTRQRLGFEERSIGVSLNQLLAEQWSAGVSYRFTSSELNVRLLDADNSGTAANGFTNANNAARSDLRHLAAYLLFHRPSGFFARAEANWFAQDNILHTYDTNSARVQIGLPSDEFPQFNFFLGWRLLRQRGDVTFGVLNVGGGDYHLNPLNSYPELPHERVYAAQLRLRF